MAGRVVHFEVPFSDGERAKDFYQQAFGWKINEIPEVNYTGVSTGPVAEERECPPNPDTSAGACSNANRHFPKGR